MWKPLYKVRRCLTTPIQLDAARPLLYCEHVGLSITIAIDTAVMPQTPSKAPPQRSGAYSTSAQSGDQAKPGGGGKTKGNTWTADELKLLFHFAVNRNGRGWGESVPGRTSSQASQAWT